MSENEIEAGSNNTVIRAHFSCTGSRLDDIVVDLIVDQNRQWVESVPAAGWWGKVDSDDVWPFILTEGGILDFGNTLEEPTASDERFASFEISDKPLLKGESYHFSHYGVVANFKLVRDDDLATLG